MKHSVTRFAIRSVSRPIACLAALPALLLVLPLNAADFVVTTNTDVNNGACTASECSLRDAILAANAISEPSTIHLGHGNHVNAIAGSGEDASVTGDFDVTGDLTIIGAGRDVTGINIMTPSEQVIDVAVGARLRLEHLSVGIGLRSGGFGGGDPAATRLELIDVKAGGFSGPGNTIVAKGNLLIDGSTVQSSNFSPGQAAILFEGASLDIVNSSVVWAKLGLRVDLGLTGSARIANSFLTRDDPYRSNICGSVEIIGGQSVRILGSQVRNRAAIGVGTCINGAQHVAIVDSAITVDGNNYNNAVNIAAATTTIRNSTIVGSLGVSSGSTLLDHVTVGSNFDAYGVPPYSVARADDASVTVSNSALIGACSGTVSAFGNNVESPGNTCGLPAASSRVDQTYSSLELGTLDSHNPTGTPVLPVNFLPDATSALNRVFTTEGIARCRDTDQRGYLRAAVCTIGAVETDATEQMMFRNGFDD